MLRELWGEKPVEWRLRRYVRIDGRIILQLMLRIGWKDLDWIYLSQNNKCKMGECGLDSSGSEEDFCEHC